VIHKKAWELMKSEFWQSWSVDWKWYEEMIGDYEEMIGDYEEINSDLLIDVEYYTDWIATLHLHSLDHDHP
jgi:hypothetical protein